MSRSKIIVSDGLLWWGKVGPKDNIVSCFAGDQIARANGLNYVERFVKKYDEGTELILDSDLTIK